MSMKLPSLSKGQVSALCKWLTGDLFAAAWTARLALEQLWQCYDRADDSDFEAQDLYDELRGALAACGVGDSPQGRVRAREMIGSLLNIGLSELEEQVSEHADKVATTAHLLEAAFTELDNRWKSRFRDRWQQLQALQDLETNSNGSTA